MTDFHYNKTDTILKINDVSLTLNGHLILKNINLDIKKIERPDCIQGSIKTILSPSGIGKTQLLKCIAGLYNCEDNNDPKGFAYFTGEVLITKKLKKVQLGDVGVVQQDYPVWRHRTVLSNLMRSAHRLPNNEKKDKVETYLNHFGLYEKRNLYPVQLSGGQNQRLAIAQSFINAEHTVLLDEPFSGLDVNMIDRVSEMIVNTANLDSENNIILVSHDIGSSCAIADELWLLGKDKDQNGNWIDGAYIKNKYDLIERNLAWHKDIRQLPEFFNLTAEVRNEFRNLG